VLTLIAGIVSSDREAQAKAQPPRVVLVVGTEASAILSWDPNRNQNTMRIFLTTDRQRGPNKFKYSKNKEEWAAWEKGELEFELIMLSFNH
jgi:hypothetical protein